VLQNASKCTTSKENMPKFFWGGASQTPPPLGPKPHPVGAFGTSIRVPSALLQTTFLDTGLISIALNAIIISRE